MALKRNWWKWLGVLLVLYSLLAGMLVPLGPGIEKVTPSSALSGSEITLKITGYNTQYETENVDAWLSIGEDRALPANHIEVISHRQLWATFQIPTQLPNQNEVLTASLIIQSNQGGIAVLPNALFIRSNLSVPGNSTWQPLSKFEDTSGFHFPYRNLLKETIRNTYYHVPLWMAMMIIYTLSMVYSVDFLRHKDIIADRKAYAYASTGTLFGILGILTGMIWAKNTWGAYWSFDVKQNMAAIALLIYAAYFILRTSLADPDVARRFTSAYNVFAFIMLIPLLFVIPRMTESLHPGSGGNPAFASEDLDRTMRFVFYPAVLGWILIGIWISNLYHRFIGIKEWEPGKA